MSTKPKEQKGRGERRLWERKQKNKKEITKRDKN
jgi:hypothetical protein